MPSRAALMTGRPGIHTGVVNHGGLQADLRLEGAGRGFADRWRSHNLPAVLRGAGLHTASISPFAERHGAWWFCAGFSEMHNTGRGGMESAEEITPTVLRWIEANGRSDNWFLHVNYWDPHTPYRAPAEFGNPFADEPVASWLTEDVLAEHQSATGCHTARDMYMWDDRPLPQYPRYTNRLSTMADLKHHMDGYDCGIAYMDQHIGRVLNALADQGALDDLVILVTSDHGENQGEFGIYGEHGTADHATCRVPMIVRWPGGAEGTVEAGLHYNYDLGPTLAELLSRPPSPTWEGRSYAPAVLRGEECGRERIVISQCTHVCQRGVRWGPWLYMRTYHDGFRLFPREMLFDVEEDPHQQRDLSGDLTDIRREGAAHYLDWHDGMMAAMPDGYTTDPLEVVLSEGGPYHARGQLRAYCERLRATGRADAAEELPRRHPNDPSLRRA
jgi:arylsulfatase A-like enzyme